MPLYLNKERFSIKGKAEKDMDSIQKEYSEFIKKEVDKLEWPLIFRSVRRKGKTNGHTMPSAIIAVVNELRDEGSAEWAYSDGGTKVDKKNRVQYTDQYIKAVTGELIVQRNNPELAFFMLKKCPHTKKDGLGDWYLVDEKKVANENVEKKRAKIEADYYVNTLLSDEELRNLARGFCHITTPIEKMSENQVRNLLDSKLITMAADNPESYKNFVMAAKNTGSIEIKARVVKAISQKIIEVDYEKHFVGYKGDKTPLYNFTFEEIGKEIDAIAKFCEGEGYAFYKNLCISLGYAVEDFWNLKDKNPDLFKKEVRNYATKVGIKTGGVKSADLEVKVKEHWDNAHGTQD